MQPTLTTEVTSVTLPVPHLSSGKVREMFALGDELLIVTTDRLSAHDIVFEQGIVDKGAVLTHLSDYWFNRLEAASPHHRLTTDIDDIIEHAPELVDHRHTLAGRSMLCRRAEPLPVECVVRGYLDGSAWREYTETGMVTGIEVPPELERGGLLPKPIFTPATKAETGHDVNISYDELASTVGDDLASQLRDRSLALYTEARAHALERGLILADTKFEFGWTTRDERELLLIDEVLTPDSSRYWDATEWSPGGAQASFDKQPIRDFLDSQRAAGRWNGEPPLPQLPDSAVRATTERYREAHRRITGRELPRYS